MVIRSVTISAAAAALTLLLAAPANAFGKDKRERAHVALPLVVQPPSVASRTFEFKEGDFWGAQAASYRSAVTIAEPIALPELWDEAVIPAGVPLVELDAVSKRFAGKLFCAAKQRNPKMPGTLMCLADRDGDGAMDQIWTAVGNPQFLVPFSEARSLKSIPPVQVRRVEDPQRLAIQFGFFVSGANPLFGTHHFYPMLSMSGELGYIIIQSGRSVTLKQLPRTISIEGAEIRVESVRSKQYRVTVTRPIPAGERLLIGEVPRQTMYIYVPG